MENLHKPVMINEIISFIPYEKPINVIDATFGGGGYSKAILEKINVNQLTMAEFRLREEKLKKKWSGINDMVPVNAPQYIYVNREKEEEFYSNMYPDPKERAEYEQYREEW